jgi:hypothetical protein
LHVVNICSLAPTHARPTQTSLKNFEHPKLLIRRSKKYNFLTPAKLIARRIFTIKFKKI